MARKKVTPIPDLRDEQGWQRESVTKLNGRNVEPGTELSVRGIRGRVRFIELVHAPAGSWVTVSEPKQNNYRSVHLDAVKTVHTKKKARPKKGRR